VDEGIWQIIRLMETRLLQGVQINQSINQSNNF